MPIGIAALALGGLAVMTAVAAWSATPASKSMGKASVGLLGKLMPDPKNILLGVSAAAMVMKYLYTNAQVSMTALGANISERFKGLFSQTEAQVYKSKDIIISGATAIGTTIAEAETIKATIAGMPTQAEAANNRGQSKTEALVGAALAATTIAGGLSGSIGNTGDKSISGQNSKTKEKEVAAAPDVIAGDRGISSDASATANESIGKTEDVVSSRAPAGTGSSSVLDPTRRDAKTQVKEKAKELAETSTTNKKNNKNDDKRAFTTCCDLRTNKCYDGISGYLPSNTTRNDQVDKAMSTLIQHKVKKLESEGLYNQAGKPNLIYVRKGDVDQCAEYNAINNAINDGSVFGPHLLVYTVDAKGNVKPPCENCQFLYKGKVTFVGFNPRSLNWLIRNSKEVFRKTKEPS